MIRNVFLNGKINTLLVVEDEAVDYSVNPLFEAIKQQAERIELLEQQNSSLIKQEEILLNILDLSARASSDKKTPTREVQNNTNFENLPYLDQIQED